MLLYLINPHNACVSIVNAKDGRWNKYRIWKPLNLLVLAALTPREWEIKVLDENLGDKDYSSMPRPDLVGITAFTSQATRAYELAREFRRRGVRVVIGGIHATMCQKEASQYADAIVTGEAETIWPQVMEDARRGELKRVYAGGLGNMERIPPARHDLLPTGYFFGSIQTNRGCPLNCNFCSVTAFNGGKFRYRPIEDVIEELKAIPEKNVLIVDDNLIGTRKDHIARAKDLFRAMIKARVRKRWIAQVTINMADDDELLTLAAQSGCRGVFIGFESSTEEGLIEVRKKFNIQKGRDFKASVRRMQRHGIIVTGSFIMGLDSDKKGVGKRLAQAGLDYGLDIMNVMFLTPFPGTGLWEQMLSNGRISANNFPRDWQYYTLTFPVAAYKHLSWEDMLKEVDTCVKTFYSYRHILRRLMGNLWWDRKPLNAIGLVISNLNYRGNQRINSKTAMELDLSRGDPQMQTEVGREQVRTASR